MTIQKRSRSRNSDYDSGYEPERGQIRANQGQSMARFGLSIYRKIEADSLSSAIQHIESNCSGYIVKKRVEGGEIPLAISILERREVQRILSMGNLAVKTVNDYLYENVKSLRSTLKVEPDPDGVELFGWNNSIDKMIGVTLKQPSLDQLLQERGDIVDALSELTHYKEGESGYQKVVTLHIPLARILANTPGYMVERAKTAVRVSLPKEALILKKAVIYDPGSDPKRARYL
jgi:hypothetical protein